uniref:Olfactory receptor n=1 Tax=Podarcis muralis TaxID=64176 RepID=A0A670JZ04_PODMU
FPGFFRGSHALHNQTSISEMVLLGISALAEHQSLLFFLFLFIYLLTLLGNLLIILLIRFDDHLRHTPMYFFLSYLSLADAMFASTTVPKILMSLMSETKTISFNGCLIQMYFFLTFGNTDNFLLACMAYDRYVAICRPLHYTTMMSHKCCLVLASGSWIVSALHSLLYTLLVSRLSFCASREIPYLFCDPLLQLSCSDTSVNEAVIFFEGVIVVLGPFVLVILTYVRIVVAVMKLSSSGRRKAFSTCGSHLTMVTLFYGAIIAVYFLPTSSYSSQRGAVFAVVYTVITPMSNPYIYSLRNKDVKEALWGLLGKRVFLQQS